MKYLFILLSIMLVAGIGLAEIHAVQKPNIVLIMADDIGFECYGCYGSELYKTPNIDRLAETGAKFTHAHAQPVCTPSRVKLMTGKYNIHNYVNFGVLDPKERTFGHMLRDAGYKTCVSGKWQLTPGDLSGPFNAGFDEYCLWNFHTGFEVALTDVSPEFESDYSGKASRYHSRYKNPGFFANGKAMENTDGKYGPDIASDFIVDFIDRNKDVPFFVYYPMILVHNPICPTPDSPQWNAGTKRTTGRENKQRLYEQMVEYMDKMVGKIVKKLDEEGLRENTIIIVTSDNGTTQGIRSPLPGRGVVMGGKNSTTDNGTRAAFVVNWKDKIKPGTIIDSPTDLADVLPTLAEITGAKMPEDVDGRSFWPLLQRDKSKERGWVFISYGRGGGSYVCYVQNRRWKLYADGSLYDVPNDWNEDNPVTGSQADEARKRLSSILEGILKDVPPHKISKEGKKVKIKTRK